MKKVFPEELNKYRVKLEIPGIATPYTVNNQGYNGTFKVKSTFGDLFVISTQTEEWEHVSVSKPKCRIPTWKEMCYIKDLFFDEDEVVVQYHPRKKEYVNVHPGTLHLWRKVDDSISTPPSNLV